jgi:chemotaxis response regulator CheB
MPKRAIDRGCVDEVLPAADVPAGVVDAGGAEVDA